MLDLDPDVLAEVRRLLARHVPDTEVWAYGSRLTGGSHEGSDLDLVVRNPGDLLQPAPGVTDLKDALEASDVPILVDVLDWACIPEEFRREIQKQHMVFREGRPSVPTSMKQSAAMSSKSVDGDCEDT